MIILGLTGGIGSGKTIISSALSKMGYPTFNSDSAAKHLMQTDRSLIQLLVDSFGSSIYKGVELQREKLASIVFNDKSELDKLNSIVHPAVEENFKKWCTEQNRDIVIKEAAILFESGADKHCDYTIAVVCNNKTRIERVISRDNMDRDLILERIKNQLSTEELTKRSDYVIINDNKTLVLPQILKIISNLTTTTDPNKL